MTQKEDEDTMQTSLLNLSLTQALTIASVVVSAGPGCGASSESSEISIPGGRFIAGADCNERKVEPGCDGALQGLHDSRHPVYLNDFIVDRHLVTDADYEQCVKAGACAPQKDIWCSYNGGNYEEFAWSLAAISYRDAQSYCRWRGKRLPTSYEFERIAHNTGARNVTDFAQWVDATGDGYTDGLLKGFSRLAFQALRPEDLRDEDGITRAFFRCARSVHSQ